MGIGYRLPGGIDVAGRDCCTSNWFDLTDAVGFQLGLRVHPLDRQAAEREAGEQ